MIKCKRLTFLLFITFYFSDKILLNQAFLTKSIDFLLCMSIIISEEREISKWAYPRNERNERKY